MDTNDEKINNVLLFADRLIEETHYSADKIEDKANSLRDRLGQANTLLINGFY